MTDGNVRDTLLEDGMVFGSMFRTLHYVVFEHERQ